MIDIKLIRTNPDLVKENIKKKFQDEKIKLVDEVIELDKEYRAAQTKADELRNKRKTMSKQIGALMQAIFQSKDTKILSEQVSCENVLHMYHDFTEPLHVSFFAPEAGETDVHYYVSGLPGTVTVADSDRSVFISGIQAIDALLADEAKQSGLMLSSRISVEFAVRSTL